MMRHKGYLGWLALLLPINAPAQVPVGNGLQGAYYASHNFEHYVLTRRDATLDFDWHERRPVAGAGAEQFSVRWTGWLLAPLTGRYVLHLSIDDGVRLWINERLLLDDWRDQGLNYYQVAVDLHAGQAYPIRLDYCQASAATRVRLAWELPAGATAHRQRNAADNREAVVIPTRYLFSAAPALPPVPQLAEALVPSPASVTQPATPTSILLERPSAGVAVRPRPRSYLSLLGRAPLASARPAPGESPRTVAVAARLAAGQRVTLPALYFAQGQADLLPPAQASLDTLAQVLGSQPTLRLEVQGHTDNQGDPVINQRLSRQRAAAVCAYLTAHGVAASRLRAVGYGGSRPVADNTQPNQRPRNRRVVLQPLGQQ
ncbi:PA14 domain-containing protein [Hymenobacter sp. BT559]|uniref:PA14 domain-containing protein n=1 Tax=Hymenobacter sp. BT559 TaxID=2795729 RepID=UPI0018EBFD35|nr:PA14 domain-containing protein [Hymenobacter sp. BT559]MBJ6146460.1 OmpA family protein [Hymenobacter sp. BT559]